MFVVTHNKTASTRKDTGVSHQTDSVLTINNHHEQKLANLHMSPEDNQIGVDVHNNRLILNEDSDTEEDGRERAKKLMHQNSIKQKGQKMAFYMDIFLMMVFVPADMEEDGRYPETLNW
jgi:hypothetical protein